MSTPSLSAAENEFIPSINSYWAFVQDVAHQDKTIVQANGNKLGIARPNTFEKGHITFINKAGAKLRSDDHTKIVDHFKKAFTNKYQSQYGSNFLEEVFSSDNFQGALTTGLSYHIVSSVYQRVCFAKLSQLSREIDYCAIEAEQACETASLAPLHSNVSKSCALTAKDELDRAKTFLVQMQEIAQSFPDDNTFQDNIKLAKSSVSRIANVAREVEEIVKRNQRVFGGGQAQPIDTNEEVKTEEVKTDVTFKEKFEEAHNIVLGKLTSKRGEVQESAISRRKVQFFL